MRPNLIKTLLLSVILAVTSLEPLSIQAQTRPRRVSPIRKTTPRALARPDRDKLKRVKPLRKARGIHEAREQPLSRHVISSIASIN
jgi:hypothetical protein